MYNYPGAQITTSQLYQNPFTNPQVGQEVIRVNGIAGAYQCALPPGTRSILVTDTEKPLAYLITTDGVNRNVQTFDIALHQESGQQPTQTSNNSLEQALESINNKLETLEGEVNELKSNTTSSGQPEYKYNKSKSNGNSNAASH